jgi:hypothetical protein
MAKVRFKPKARGFRRILTGPDMRAFLQGKADAGLVAAQANAPVDTGAYVEGLYAEVIEHPSRLVGRVGGRDPKTLIIEANTGNLARALDAALGGG